MKKLPYINRPDDLTLLMQKLPGLEVRGGKIDVSYIKSLGFSAASSKQLMVILKMLGFVDEQDLPSSVWVQYKTNKERALVLAAAIKNAYPFLFDMVFCPYLEGDDTIIEIFKHEEPRASSRDMSLMVDTFRRLSDLADFQDLLHVEEAEGLTSDDEEKAAPDVKVNPNLQWNIQVHIDPNTPDEKIEVIFKAMRKYLLDKKTDGV